MTRVKICGLTRVEDVRTAVKAGAHMVGFIHVPGAERHVEALALPELLAAAKEENPDIRRMIVVRNLDEDNLKFLQDTLDFEAFQFHGDETPELVRQFDGYKVVKMDGAAPNPTAYDAYPKPLVIDAGKGGEGITFDWSMLDSFKGDYIVAGGLDPDNVGTLVRTYKPWGVDVSSGVCRADDKRIKDPALIHQFIQEVEEASKA